ncbi:PREDICTED: zinc finger protein 736-like [Priapulus caudatus]|uniref:Zinc finger protein 736-like n=1 Tax=Priapulus caudatus TaxID=37621 RepID=A0ABM1E446_PRICU|nr:PREDICTED: zinc finger protein 736-like [Priapulus caudatus]
MEANQDIHQCSKCDRKFNVKSNLTRHMKTHEDKGFQCAVCDKTFTLKQNLDSHAKQHLYPNIPLYKNREARLKCSAEALDVASHSNKEIEDVWLDPKTAETAAKRSGSELWRANVIITFGKYAGKSFKWLLENDVGWVVWLLDAYSIHGEKCPRLLWQKERLLELVRDIASVMCHLDNRLKKRKENKEMAAPATDIAEEYIEDAELLAMAEYKDRDKSRERLENYNVGS